MDAAQDGQGLIEMALTRKKAEQQVSGLEWPINLHLVKLLGFVAPPTTRAAWKRELREWFTQIATLRVKPDRRPLPARTLHEWLYAERFEGSETENIAAMLALPDTLTRNGATPAEVAGKLAGFHQAAIPFLAAGELPRGPIEAL